MRRGEHDPIEDRRDLTLIKDIHQTTLDAVREALKAGLDDGKNLHQRSQWLKGLPAFDQAREEVVARTELARSVTLACHASYGASGVVGVLVHDGDYDEECAAMDGRRFALDDAPRAAG